MDQLYKHDQVRYSSATVASLTMSSPYSAPKCAPRPPEEWAAAGARITAPPEAKPFKLYEFHAPEIDGDDFRAFYDFAWDER